MNRHDDDDDLDLDLEDDVFDENGVVKDGRSVRCPIQFMDSVQRSVYEDSHRPGWRTPDHVQPVQDQIDKAYSGYVKHLQDGHKSTGTNVPVAQPRSTVPTGTVAKPTRPTSLQDAEAARDAAHAEYVQWLRDAHKQKRKPLGPKLPHGWAFGDQPNGT